MRQSGVWRMGAVCVCVLWVNQWAVAVTVRDRVGDGGRFDVVAVQADVQGGSARFTIHYGDDLIGMATGAGGTLSIDADRNRQTGLKGTPGFDCEITYSVSQLAPTATLTISWPAAMDQIPINVWDDPYQPLFAVGHGLTY